MPVRFRDLKRALEALGCEVVEPASGSHWQVRREGRVFPIAAHNGLKSEIPDVYVRGACRLFAIDEASLRRKL